MTTPWLPSETESNRVPPRECVAAARRALDKTYPLGQGEAAIPLLIEAVDWLRRALEQMVAGREETTIRATTFQWLIERGQPEGQEPTVWLEPRQGRDPRWTQNANEAAMFPTREEAEEYIHEHLAHPTRGASARAVEHGFMSLTGREETYQPTPSPDGVGSTRSGGDER